MGQEVDIRPGLIVFGDKGRTEYKPATTKIASILAGNRSLKFSVLGEVIVLETQLDSGLGKRELLTRQILGASFPTVRSSKYSIQSHYFEIYQPIRPAVFIDVLLLPILLGNQTQTGVGQMCSKLSR